MAGPEGVAHRHLALPGGGPREQQVAEVRARDEQHEHGRAHQHDEPALHAVQQDVLDRLHAGHDVLRELRPVAADGVHHRVELHGGLFARHPGLQPREPGQEVLIAVAAERRVEPRGHPVLVVVVEEREVRRHHAHHRVGRAVDGQRPIDGIAGREEPARKARAEQDDRRRARIVVRDPQGATHGGLPAEHLEHGRPRTTRRGCARRRPATVTMRSVGLKPATASNAVAPRIQSYRLPGVVLSSELLSFMPPVRVQWPRTTMRSGPRTAAP